jgi:hypothetical protein
VKRSIWDFPIAQALSVVGICVLALCLAFGEDKLSAPQFSELGEAHILIAYQKALIAQTEAQTAQQNAANLANAYVAECAKEVKAAGMPEGTQCQPNVATGKVTTVAPPKAEKKAETPAKK